MSTRVAASWDIYSEELFKCRWPNYVFFPCGLTSFAHELLSFQICMHALKFEFEIALISSRTYSQV